LIGSFGGKLAMRYYNRLAAKKSESAKGVLTKMNAKDGDNSSESSDGSMESELETNKNNSVMNDHFNWSVQKPGLGMTKTLKSFSVLCEGGESENNEKREFSQAPTSR
jgi:hypothetical protein